MARPSVAVALVVSLGLHGAAGVWVKVGYPRVETPASPPVDVWSGRGIEVAPAEVDTVSVGEPGTEAATPSTDERAASELEHAIGVEPACVSDCAPAETKSAPREEKRPARPKATTPVPTPKVVSSAQSVSSATASSAPPSATASSDTTASAADAFGMVGLPPGVRHLPKAYTRALNQGSWRVAGFRTVAAGKLCEGHVSIGVGADRRLGALEYRDERERDALPPLCRTMFENGHRLVANGEFSLDPKRLTDGVMRLRIEVHVTDGEAPTESEDSSKVHFSFESPTEGKRGRSTFVLTSGRRVDAFVDVE